MSPERDEVRCAPFRRIEAAEEACRRGDLDALRLALGDPPGFPGCVLAAEFLGLADRPLDLAIRLGPLELIERMLTLGADPRAPPRTASRHCSWRSTHHARTATRSSPSFSRTAPTRSSAG